ncbi:type 4a pilus biogenesis protein PilO [Ferrimonas gelatinilytica]|uniref:Type 4a pilus biogenesis protein PilO n=2 Tax=Ferrimonas gelatinilytica TaxID=1255257 RepID=A0ABP9SAA9_9GAMM
MDLKLEELEIENIGIWPKEVKIITALILLVATLVLGYFLMLKDSLAGLERLEQQEMTFKQEFERKYRMAANLPKYREQLAQMKEQFQEMLAMLPTANEMPGLLDSVTYLATDAELAIQSLSWQPESRQEFYVEMPIEVEIRGSYHDFGRFSAGVAALPRIVSLHDFVMKPEGDDLAMTVMAKTYRFSEEGGDAKEGKKK